MPEIATAAPAPAAKPAIETKVDPKAAPTNGAVNANEPTREIKVDGKVIKVTESQLIALAQKGAFADKKLSAMDLVVKNTQGLLNSIRTPEGLLAVAAQMKITPETLIDKLLGSDISDAAKETVGRVAHKLFVEEPKLTPQQIEDRKKLTDYERLKKQETERQQKESAAKQQAQVQQMYQSIKSEVSKAILADKSVPQTEEVIRRVVDKIRVVNRNFSQKQGRDLTLDEVKTVIPKAIGWVNKDNLVHQTALFDAVMGEPEKLIALVGEERALAISRALVARIQARSKENGQKQRETPQRREKTTEKIDREMGRTPQGFKLMDI